MLIPKVLIPLTHAGVSLCKNECDWGCSGAVVLGVIRHFIVLHLLCRGPCSNAFADRAPCVRVQA